MKQKLKKLIRPALFTFGGALLGFGYYYFIGCMQGTCPITSNPWTSTIYMGIVGFLVSGIFTKECDGGCNM